LWVYSPSGGFLHPNYQNKAVSYLSGLDVLPEHPDGLVAGDRNVRFNVAASSCSSGINGVPGLARGQIGIGDGLHVEAGNYLFTDGRVEELSSRALVARWLAIYGWNDNGTSHYLVP
jgi:prepilin-type processing-associated H-X9-DG protein